MSFFVYLASLSSLSGSFHTRQSRYLSRYHLVHTMVSGTLILYQIHGAGLLALIRIEHACDQYGHTIRLLSGTSRLRRAHLCFRAHRLRARLCLRAHLCLRYLGSILISAQCVCTEFLLETRPSPNAGYRTAKAMRMRPRPGTN